MIESSPLFSVTQKSTTRIEYIKFREGKRKELAKAMKTLDLANPQGIREEMDQYDRIRDKISGIISIVKDMNTLTQDMHRDACQ